MTKQETKKKRIERKQREFQYSVYRTAASVISTLFAILGFLLSLAIFWRVYR